MTDANREILDLEKRFWSESGDPEFFDNYTTANALTVIEPMGTLDKSKAIKMSEGAEPWKYLEVQDINFADFTPDCVALTYHAKANNGKTGEPYRGSVCSVYVQEQGQWKLGLTTHQPWKEAAAPDAT